MSFLDDIEKSTRTRPERSADIKSMPISDGITAKPILGKRLSIQEVVLAPNAVFSLHTHGEEQMGYVVSGAMDFTDGEHTWRLGPGDLYYAPSGSPHGATATDEGCVVVDAFSPPREQIRKLLAERQLFGG